jgi:hypothetical protein
MWNKSHSYKNTYTLHLKSFISTYTISELVQYSTAKTFHGYIYIHISKILSAYTKTKDELVLGNKNLSAEKNECVFKYRFSATLNSSFSFIRILRLDGRLLKMLMPGITCFSEDMTG